MLLVAFGLLSLLALLAVVKFYVLSPRLRAAPELQALRAAPAINNAVPAPVFAR